MEGHARASGRALGLDPSEEDVMQRIKLLAGTLALGLLLACYGNDYVTEPPVYVSAPGNAVTIVGSGVSASQTRLVPDFTAVIVTAPFRVVLAQGGGPSLEVTADDNVLPFVRSEVRGDRLVLGFKAPLRLTRAREILCRVTLAELREAEALGAAVIEMSGVDADRLVVRLSGASFGRASGTTRDLTLDASGASRWDAAALRARSVRATVSGASFALQRVSDSLRADLSGASTLKYLGDPVVVSSVSGASSVRRVGP
jgi:Putative auto-transporter adhesin, head GIN domain